MTVAPAFPPVHSYSPNKDPMEMWTPPLVRWERWRADSSLLGETGAAIQARHDAVTTLEDLTAREAALAAE